MNKQKIEFLNNNFLNLCKLSSDSYVEYYIKNRNKFYNSFTISKKNNKGVRQIFRPNDNLKSIQKNILKNILYSFGINSNANGFVKKKSIVYNAKKHINKQIIFKTDIIDFFPNITSDRVYGLFDRLGFNEKNCNYLTDLCTYKNMIPQGAPTSPYISNLICFRLDKRLTNLALKLKLEYSRYADDITFSGKSISKSVIDLIYKIVKDEGFMLSKDKSVFLSKGNRQKITGLIVNDKLSVGRKNYHNIKRTIYNCKIKGVSSVFIDFDKDPREYLFGKISIFYEIDVLKWFKLKKEIDSIDWNSFYYSTNTHKKIVKKNIKILQLIKLINTIKPLFKKNSILLIKTSLGKVKNYEKFLLNLMDINSFVDRINFKSLDISEEDKLDNTLKSIKALEYFFKIKKIDLSNMEVLNDIKNLTAEKRHSGQKLKKITKRIYVKYGFNDFNDVDYKLFYEKIIDNFRNFLEKLFIMLS
ncbi:MAG: reverse transcriptase family protein [Candidatus Nanoarchaeia archaeon]|jgi:retron-type reverse transcriptase